MEKQDLSKLRIDRGALNAGQEKAPTWWWYAGGILVLLLLIILLRGGGAKSAKPAPENQTVQTTTAGVSPFAPTASVLNATGYVVAQRRAAIGSKATGKLKSLNVVEGDLVKEGDVIAVLENDDLKAVVAQSEANVAQLEARSRSAEAELTDARLQFERSQNLKVTNSVSQAQLDQAKGRFDKAAADVAGAQAAIALAKASLEKARVDLGYTEIIAPFDGTVLTKNADVGEIVTSFSSSTNARAAVVTIADMSSLEVEADVSEANIAKVFVGQQAEITLDSYPEKKYRGVVDKIVPTVDRAKATVLTKIKFLERDERVLPEMSAKVSLKVKND